MSSIVSAQDPVSLVFSEGTKDSIESDLIATTRLFEELARFSVLINEFVNSRFLSTQVGKPDVSWAKTVEWLNKNSGEIREDLKGHTILIRGGPVELLPTWIRFRINDDSKNRPSFDAKSHVWHKVNPLPLSILTALGARQEDVKVIISPSTTRLHDVMIRYRWDSNANNGIEVR